MVVIFALQKILNETKYSLIVHKNQNKSKISPHKIEFPQVKYGHIKQN